MHINDLFENALNEVFDYLSLAERVKCELVCRRWRQVLAGRAQRAIKLCFETKCNQTKPICSNRSHQVSSNDVLYFEEEESSPTKAGRLPWFPTANNLTTINLTTNNSTNHKMTRNGLTEATGKIENEAKFDRLLAKFGQTTAVHLQSKDIKLLRRSNVLAGLSKHAARLQHVQIELFEGPFTRNDLLLLFKNWTKTLKCLVITFHFDNGKYLNRRTIMKLLEICIDLELLYWKAPHLCTQNLEYVPSSKLTALHLYETELDLESLSLLARENGANFRQLRLANITGDQLNIIFGLSALRLLSVDSIVQLPNLSVLAELRRLTRLEVLRFWLEDKGDGRQVNNLDNELIAIMKACNGMRKLHVENAVLSDSSISLVSIYWKHLQSFKLYSSTFNADEAARHSHISDRSLLQLLKLDHLHTLAIPNGSLSQPLLEQLIDRPPFGYLVLRERCSFVDHLFRRMLAKAARANHNEYKLKIGDEDALLRLVTIDRPTNFKFKKAKVFNFDLF